MAVKKTEPKRPRILLFDLETAPHRGLVWGHWKQNVLSYEKRGYLLAVGYKWLGEKKTTVLSLPDYKGYKGEDSTEKYLVRDLFKLLDEADIVIGHNAKHFDVKVAMARFMQYDLGRPSFFRVIDTKDEYKKIARSSSNKLDHLGDEYHLGRKVPHQGIDLWIGCMAGDEKCWRTMVKYNRQDVVLLENWYLKLRSYMDSHPNVSILGEDKHACPTCGSKDLRKRGKRWTNLSIAQYWQCNMCGGYSYSKFERQAGALR